MSPQAESNIFFLNQPGTGQNVAVSINAPNMRLQLGFDLNSAVVEKNGQNLDFCFDNKGKLILEGYYDNSINESLPVIITKDGDELSGEDILTEAPSTAQGPGTGVAGSGEGEYADHPGDLIGGIDRLGSLGTAYWDRSTELPELYYGHTDAPAISIALVPMIPGTKIPVGPVAPGTPTTPDNPQYYIDGQGFNLRVDESYMPGGTNYNGHTTPVYLLEFLITTNDDLTSASVNGTPISEFPVKGIRHNNGYLSTPQLTDNGDGTYTLTFDYTQGNPEQHAPGDGKNISDNADTFIITATTDSGVSASVAMNVDIVDDVPWVSVENNPALDLGTAIVDESALANGTKDSSDSNLILKAVLSAATVEAQFSSEYGYDGQGAADMYSLALSGTNVPSGLCCVASSGGKGAEIVLNQSANVITGSADGVDYFAITIDPATGEVTLTLRNNLHHPDSDDHDDAVTLALPEGVLMLTKTVTDGDGDTASASFDLGAAGAFAFEDDGPIATDDKLALLFTKIAVTGNVLTGDFTTDANGQGSSGAPDHFGADGEAPGDARCAFDETVTFTPADGSPSITLTMDSDGSLSHNGQSYGQLILTTDGSGGYSYSRPPNLNIDGEISAEYTIQDGDGDTSTSTLTIGVESRFPTTAVKAVGNDLVVHEDGLSWGTSAKDPNHPTSTDGYVEIDSFDGIASITFTVNGIRHGIDLPSGWNGASAYFPGLEGTFDADLGTMVITSIKFNTVTGMYEAHFTYTLKENTLAHSDDGDGSQGEHHDLLSEGDTTALDAMPKVDVVVTDNSGLSSATNTIEIDVHDDGPMLDLNHAQTGYQDGPNWVDDGQVHLGKTYTTTGTIVPDYGADRAYGADDDFLLVSFEGILSVKVNGALVEHPVGSNAPILVQFDDNGEATVHTGLGVITFTKAANGTISYRYTAKHGMEGDHEAITFTVMDGDKDIANQAVTVTMDHDVPAGTAYVDESGLDTQGPDGYAGLGSHHPGHDPAFQIFTVFLPENATEFNWNLGDINANHDNRISADGDGDGVYSPVTWSVDPLTGNLIATAEGQTILAVTPPQSDGAGGFALQQDADGNWYGTMEATLHYPIKHADGESYNVHGLHLNFDAVSPDGNGGTQVESNAIAVAVIDDAPNAMDRPATVVEAVPPAEDVYLLMDVSGSVNDSEMKTGMMALLQLAEQYKAQGIEAAFTLISFGTNYRQWDDAQMSVDELIAILRAGLYNPNGSEKTDALVAAYFSGGVRRGTNYDAVLDYTQSMIEAAQQDGTYRFYNQKVYFISDGVPNSGQDIGYTSWKSFIEQHQGVGNDRVEVYAIGVGAGASEAVLKTITADGADHYIPVTGYNDLADKLADLVQPGSATGNLFGIDIDNDDVRSADLTTVLSVHYNHQNHDISSDGFIEVILEDSPDGAVTLTVWPNGDYSITSTMNIDDEATYDLGYTITDADGDTSTAVLKIVLKDAKPEAFDNVAPGPDPDYHGAFFVLDDFDSRTSDTPVWHASNTAVTYGVRLANDTAFTDINGDPGTTSGSDSFVRIEALEATHYLVNFNTAVKDAVGFSISELFGAPTALSGGMIQQSFDLYTEGTISFNFLFDRGNPSSNEQAFAILKNEKDESIQKWLISTGTNDMHGLYEIPVDSAGNYTLYIGCYDTQNDSGPNAPKLYVDKVVFAPTEVADVYHGNVIEDFSPHGEIDKLGDHARLYKIRFTDKNETVHEYTVNDPRFVAGLLVLEDVFASGDKLTINDNGNYIYQTEPGAEFDNANLEYFIKEPGSSDIDSAMLYIRSEEYRHDGIDLDQRGKGDEHSHVIIGTDGNDLIYASDGGDIIYGGTGDDTIYGGAGGDVIHTGGGNNIVYGGTGKDIIYGVAGNNILNGGDDNDILYGGDGNDILYGGRGNDIMYGGAGSDLFAWKAEDYDGGTDTIMDFTLREDRLSFADIFGNDEMNIVPLKAILDALNTGKIDISVDALDDSLLQVTIGNGTSTQDVDIHLVDSALPPSQIADIHAGDEAAKAALLQQMLLVING